MAGSAGESGGMIGGGDLREIFGLGAIGFVAAGTKDGGVELRGDDVAGISGVLCRRAVTSFAGNVDVPALLFQVDDIGMAGFAGFVAGEGNRPGGDLG